MVDDAWGELCDPAGYWDAKRRAQKPRKKKRRIRERRRDDERSQADIELEVAANEVRQGFCWDQPGALGKFLDQVLAMRRQIAGG